LLEAETFADSRLAWALVATAGQKVLAGQIAILTGGASGIGRALSEELAARRCTVVLADRQLELARKVAVELESSGHAASAAELDVRDLAAFESLAQEVRARFGRIDFLFNNAGIGVGAAWILMRPRTGTMSSMSTCEAS
jgi:NAD(P)-dependent dehydrogenase (short-subunit alcohol dehydrogenase family)